MSTSELRTSPLHARHEALGATLGAFGGWSMPLSYPAGTVAEHTAVRTAVGLFDVSHLGKLAVTGPGAAAFVNRCLTADLDRITPGHAQYTLCCADDGGVVDDLIAYLDGPDELLLVPNAANAAAVGALLRAAAPAGVAVTDRHADLAVLAVQGPRSREVLAEVLPQATGADAPGHLDDLAAVGGVGDEEDLVLAADVGDEVVDDAAARLVAAQRVLRLARADLAQVVGEPVVHEVDRTRTPDDPLAQVADVEDPHGLPHGDVLLEHAAARVLDRHVPAAEVGELGAERDVAVVQGSLLQAPVRGICRHGA